VIGRKVFCRMWTQNKHEVKLLKAVSSSICLRIVSCVTVDELKFTRIIESIGVPKG
jgi:hypothetical protein